MDDLEMLKHYCNYHKVEEIALLIYESTSSSVVSTIWKNHMLIELLIYTNFPHPTGILLVARGNFSRA